MTKKINIFKNKSPYTRSVYNKTKYILREYGYKVTNNFEKDALLNLVIGGDGTFLNAVNQTNFSQIPFIGINTGHLGFYQEISPDNIEDFIKTFSKNEYQIEDLSILQGSIGNKSINCLNEIVVKSKKNQLVRLRVFIDGNFIENFSGDGLIVCTAHGSTAYNLSCNGSILHQSLQGYQLTPIAPVFSSLNKALRSSIILPNEATIDIVASKRDSHHIAYIFDGRNYFSNNNKITITVSNKKIKKLILNKNHYWTNIKNKLL
ncbi:MAG: NAD(+)/NADH kinase [Peptoniphilaceae bacterium]|nr:NAD(+)/NADH kinase [Peptoniphilaceae bacterium]MDY6018022.1 NAD(+)/NADH kinase [Anaerococcus sp.]